MDRDATLLRVRDLAFEAARKGAKIVLFPEAFVPGYPRGMIFGTIVGSRSQDGRTDWARYAHNSVSVPGAAFDDLCRISRDAGVYMTIGVVESDYETNPSTLYCTTLYFGPDGAFLGKHRKLKPTGAERLIWGEGDGSTLTCVETPYGIMGGLICWENYMPLARAAMYSKRVSLYLAPTADSRDEWQSTIRHIALEGRCFVLSCNQYVTKAMYPTDLACYSELAAAPEVMCRGGSAIIDPLGKYVAGPVFDSEQTLIADLDLGKITESRYDFDVVGHYARPDVFQLIVNEDEQKGIRRRA